MYKHGAKTPKSNTPNIAAPQRQAKTTHQTSKKNTEKSAGRTQQSAQNRYMPIPSLYYSANKTPAPNGAPKWQNQGSKKHKAEKATTKITQNTPQKIKKSMNDTEKKMSIKFSCIPKQNTSTSYNTTTLMQAKTPKPPTTSTQPQTCSRQQIAILQNRQI